jgi:prepilin-type N-terminal cleavage/methylation domain-containing protein
MRRKNNGFSLIELIVVIAILAIVSTGLVSAFFSVSGWQLKQTAITIDNGLKKTRVLALSRDDKAVSFELYKKDNDRYYMKAGGENETEIASAETAIQYVTESGVTVTIDQTKVLTLYFDRSSGAFQSISINGIDTYCKQITVTKGDKTKTITLVPVTGKTKIEE